MQEQIDRFVSCLLDGDENGAELILEEELDCDNCLDVFQLITKSMQHVGYLWEHNRISVADEHLATATCEYVLSNYKYKHVTKKKIPKNGRKAMFFCLENEQHNLGAKITSILFESYGWDVRLLGANLPLEYAVKKAEQWKPDCIGVSVGILYNLTALREYVDQLANLPGSPAILVGGRLTGLYDLKRYCSNETILLKDLHDARNYLDGKITGENGHEQSNQHTDTVLSN